MFGDDLEAAVGNPHALADLAAAVEHAARVAGCQKLVVAAAWADAHSGVDHPDGGLLVERLVRIGPAGTPLVAEFAPQGLVGPFGTSTQSVRSWMADALAIRHRLPRLWERVVAGEVHAWKARQIATLTAHLSVAVAGVVDEHTATWVEQLPWQTFLKSAGRHHACARTHHLGHPPLGVSGLADLSQDVRTPAPDPGPRPGPRCPPVRHSAG